MSLIFFDITYNKKTEKKAFQLPNDAEFEQLKFFVRGKCRFYEGESFFIYHLNELISRPMKTKLKDIFSLRHVSLVIQKEKREVKRKKTVKYFCNCKCKGGAKVICDKCDEFLCEQCAKKPKHSSHSTLLISLEEYQPFVKAYINELNQELRNQIVNDEPFQFFSYLNEDMTNELNTINQCYDYGKQELEDIKQIQINYLLEMNDLNLLSGFPSQVSAFLAANEKVEVTDDIAKMRQDKSKITKESQEMLQKYSALKQAIIYYTSNLRDLQSFNQLVMNEIKEKFLFIKKKYSTLFQSVGKIATLPKYPENYTTTLPNNSHHSTIGNVNVNLNVNTSYHFPHQETNTSFKKKPQITHLSSPNTYHGNQTLLHEKIILRLKDTRKMLAFLTLSQTFKEKSFIDHSNFKANMTSEEDVIQLNHANKLYMISGKAFNKLFYYDYALNEVYFINHCLFSHYLGAIIYSSLSNSVYLLGGNNTTKCEVYKLTNTLTQTSNKTLKSEWIEIPDLNEERQEFAAMCFDTSIYVFFGFCPKKGYNLSSIEKYDCAKSNRFEIIFVNEQITLCSISCAKINENEIILIGGFDGNQYIDNGLIFTPRTARIRESEIIIPNMAKHSQFLFHKESCFIQYDGYQVLFDMKGNAHSITADTYDVFCEITQ